EPPAALAGLSRREAFEAEPVGRQAGHRQGGGHCRWTRQDGHVNPGRDRGDDQAVARVADARHSGVGDQQHVPATDQVVDQPGHALGLDVVVVRDQPGGDRHVERGGQPAQPAGVLGRDHLGGPQRRDQRRRGILRPADRRGRQNQPALLVGGTVFARLTVHRCPRYCLMASTMTAMRAFGYAPTIEAIQAWNREPGESLRDRLVPPMPPPSVWGWLGPLLITVFGGFLRFYRLGTPHAVVFDETYYVPDAYGILKHGVEMNAIDSAKNRNVVDHLLAHGGTHILAGTGEYVVHPPLGKIMIAVGEWLFGLTPFGWRFATAAVGTLSILLIARIVRRMTRSTLLGCAAGLLLALDGLELVLSRTAILDIFVMFWVLAAFGMLVLDRDHMRGKIAEAAMAEGSGGSLPQADMAAGTGGVPGVDLPGGGPDLGIRWRR